MEEPPWSSAVLATRLSARIVHDLAGAAQGLKSALALITESTDADSRAEALALAEASATALEDRLAFCRAAYAGADARGVDEIERLSQIPFAGRRGRLRWAEVQGCAPPALTRAMLVFAQLAAAGLAAGGEAVASLARDEVGWVGRLTASGDRVRLDPDALEVLSGGSVGSPRPGPWVDGAFARALILECGGAIRVERRDGSVTLQAGLPPQA